VDLERFMVEVPQATLDNLAERLARTRWPAELDGSGWEDGTSPAYLRELVGWWQTSFDWRRQEAALNRYPQFRATVDGSRLHFVHERGPRAGAAATGAHPRLAKHLLRTAAAGAAADRPGQPRRQPRRRLRRGHPFAARLRLQ
jgi:hypothetical protein